MPAQPGTRFPHAWIMQGEQRVSTLDLFGTGPVLLAGPNAPRAWTYDVAGTVMEVTARLHQVGREFEFVSDSTWGGLTDLPNDGVVLVRPDGIVAARSDTALLPRS